MNNRANRNIPNWQRAAHLDRRVDTGAHFITCLQTFGSDNVTTLAIGVFQ
jgi:hypothetical protein